MTAHSIKLLLVESNQEIHYLNFQDPPTQSKFELNLSIEEIQVDLPIVKEEPDPIVHSQVDKDPTMCSFESLVQFKIPKKTSKTTKPESTTEDKKQTVSTSSPQADYKRGAAHENTGVFSQTWHGVLPKTSPASPSVKEGSSKTLSTVLDITGKSSEAQQHVLDGNWFENKVTVRRYLPEIPAFALTVLTREEWNEIQEEYKALMKDKKMDSKFVSGKAKVKKNKHLFDVKIANGHDWYENHVSMISFTFYNLSLKCIVAVSFEPAYYMWSKAWK